MALLLTPGQIAAERSTLANTYSLYGTPGLIDIPTAEVAPDSNLAFSLSQFGMVTRGALTFQITPRLSGTFRYSNLRDFHPVIGDYADRSFELSFRLLDETKYLPALSIGINDFLGTGIYSSEYIVATKSIGEKLRVTAGLGWGRLGSYNSIGSPFGPRPPFDFGLGGTLNYSQWFRGPVAPFGGISYRVNDKLTLKAEYSSDVYAQEVAAGIQTWRSPFNFGVDYQIRPGVNLGAFYLSGTTFAAQITVSANPRRPASRSGLEEAPLPVRPRPSRQVDPEAWSTDWVSDPAVHPGIQTALAAALKKDGQTLESMALSANRAEIRVSNSRYGATAQAVGRAARMMTRAFPASVETFVITNMRNGIPVSSVTLQRSDIEALEHAPAPDIFARARITDAAGRADGLIPTPGIYPKLAWALGPYTEINLFGRGAPVTADFGVRLSGRYEIMPGVVLSGVVQKRVLGNIASVTTPSDSVLPHVRSDAGLYNLRGDPSIEHLTLAWYGRPARNLYSRVTIGYLEPMFAGVSAEVLWKPVDSRLAVGAEVAYVRQRAYNQLFGLQPYGVVNGHVSAYYDFDNGFRTQLDVGRYLAGDVGATVSVDRVFANGWRVGAYATLTNVSAADFGEGSFDKGIRVTIPVEWALGSPSQSASSTEIRSLSRDGGARLQVNGRLFDWVQQGHGDALSQRWGRFWR